MSQTAGPGKDGPEDQLIILGEPHMEKEESKTTTGQSETETTGPRLDEQAREKVQSLKEEAVDRGRRYLELTKASAADFIRDIADAMETAATQLESKGRKATGGYIRSASREVQEWSSSLDEYGIDSMARQVQSFADRHPGIVLSGAAIAGFAVTRLFRSVEWPSNEPATAEQEPRPAPPETEQSNDSDPAKFQRPTLEEYSREFGPHS